MGFKYIVGIDEAGRGPLAGPVAVGAVCWRLDQEPQDLLTQLPAGKDSKKLTPKARAKLCEVLRAEAARGTISVRVAFGSHTDIDRRGITPTIRKCIQVALAGLPCNPTDSLILLDGGLGAPPEFIHQETIIKGDEQEPIIGLASIAAKVSRDERMVTLAADFPGYEFDKHKGYGTKAHIEAIKLLGLSPLHRRSFIHFA